MKQELQNYPDNSRLIRSFGRIKSRKLSDHKQDLLENLLPQYSLESAIAIYSPSSPTVTPAKAGVHDDCKEEQLSNSNPKNTLEIGFGFGDFLFAKAQKNPQINFFGSEPHINGVVNLLAKLEKEPLKNIKISRQDIRILLSNFPDNFFDEVYILFPDPWPKAKHYKRRLINVEFLDEILSPKLKKAAKLVIATDHDDYKTWILSEILRTKNFFWRAKEKKDWQIFPDDWTITKYQQKAVNEGREPVIFKLDYHG